MIWRVVGIWLLLLPGAALWQPVLGGASGVIPSLAGVSLGCGAAWLAAKLRCGALLTSLMLVLIYFLGGGAVGLRDTTISGVIPTLNTFKQLALLAVRGWKDLLTVAIPAGDFAGPAVLIWLCALVAGVLSATIAARTNTIYSALLAPFVWLVFSIVLGTQATDFALYVGGAYMLLSLAWVWICQAAAQYKTNLGILVNAAGTKKTFAGRALVSALMVIAVTAGALGLGNLVGISGARFVARDYVEPPIDVRAYASPLMNFRSYELDQKDDVLFTVQGMPQGARLRLATMDSYDGHVFTVSNEMGSFNRIGHIVSPHGDNQSQIDVTVGDYNQVWVPSIQQTATVDFSGTRAQGLHDSLYYSKTSSQLIVTNTLKASDKLTIGADPQPVLLGEERDKLKAANVGSVPVLDMSGIPEGFTNAADKLTEGASTAYEQMKALEAGLQQGYYSDGTDGRSRSGHTTERLTTMFSAAALIGDDEQYATAMALMANGLGIPARVVLGFYPEEYADGTWEVTGTQAHVWVEANFAEAGWLTFDPTPSRQRTPETETPKPKPKPKLQADTPPQPPQDMQDDSVLANQDRESEDKHDTWQKILAVLKIVAFYLGIVLLIAAPFIIIIALKARRRKKRINAELVHDQVAGSWSEIVDNARDAGYKANASHTRMETAHELQEKYPSAQIVAAAQRIDSVLFAAHTPQLGDSQIAWVQSDSIVLSMRSEMPWYKRILIKISPTSLFGMKSARQATSLRNWQTLVSGVRTRAGSIRTSLSRRRKKDRLENNDSAPPKQRRRSAKHRISHSKSPHQQ